MYRRALLASVSLFLTGFDWNEPDRGAEVIATQSLENSQLRETGEALADALRAAGDANEELVLLVEDLDRLVVNQQEKLLVANDRVESLEREVEALRKQSDKLMELALEEKKTNWTLGQQATQLKRARETAVDAANEARNDLEAKKQEATTTKQAARAARERLERDIDGLKRLIQVTSAERDSESWRLFISNSQYKICQSAKKAQECRKAVSVALNAQVRHRALVCMGEAAPLLVKAVETARQSPLFIVLDGTPTSRRTNWAVVVCDPTVPED
jgi:hypothetical protein